MADSGDLIRNYFLDQMKEAGLFCHDDMSMLDIGQDVLLMVNQEQAARYHIMPLRIENERLILATDTDQTFKEQTQLERELKQKVKLLLADEENLRLALLKYYQISNYRQLSQSQQKHEIDSDMTPLKGAINEMLQDAAKQNASDIHMLPNELGFQVNFRVNGHMIDVSREHVFNETQIQNVTNLIKMLDESGNSDIMQKNMPNEGSFYLRRGNQNIFIRLETLPVGMDGQEKINLRLLPQAGRGARKKTLDDIGYTPNDLQVIKSVLYRNSTGLFLNSGPTGAGKTTSLHGQIHYVLDNVGEALNVIEIAEPIEIYEPAFTQVQVRKASNEALSLTAEKILVASLRSDPDIILYNEIRNATDATVAMQASNTGHMVFSTVHAADCIRTISRLLDFDISKTTLLSELKLIISQRLVATLCPHCSKPHTLTDKERYLLTDEEEKQVAGKLRERGSISDIQNCPAHCNHGYSGRTAVAEYVIFNMEIRDALLHQRSFAEIRNVLQKNNFHSMWEKGLALAAQGKVELEELIRVIGKE